jgi:FkbM family methyltransferase
MGDSPFFHYHACFDAESVMRSHAVAGLEATPGYLTNFLGVLIDPKFFPSILNGRAGHVEDIPIPANWHADIAEWAGALRAVDLSETNFTVIELGCGWGCWLNNTGLAARRMGRNVQLIGIEGDRGHHAFAREAAATNGFPEDKLTLFHGIAAAKDGVALFPNQSLSGQNWGLEPIMNPGRFKRSTAKLAGYTELPAISLQTATKNHARIDLLHIDIQGGEADLIKDSLELLNDKVAYIVVGTHSREIEGQIFETLRTAGWLLEIERPAILSLVNGKPIVTVDGVEGWRNPNLLPT